MMIDDDDNDDDNDDDDDDVWRLVYKYYQHSKLLSQ